MTLGEGRKTYLDKLRPIYGQGEANAITRLVFEEILQADFNKLAFDRFRLLTNEQQRILTHVLTRLIAREPVQYALHVAYFCGHRFKVDYNTLIPRPETEELVYRIRDDYRSKKGPLKVLDIGTGTGCIAISLQLLHPSWQVSAVDISEEALLVAGENNRRLKAQVQFSKLDVLHENLPSTNYDIIVSNPPYIGLEEAITLEQHVVQFEPHIALFAPPHDTLAFYRFIGQKAMDALKPGGSLYFEINAAKGPQVVELLQHYGYTGVELLKDISNNPRIVKGAKPV